MPDATVNGIQLAYEVHGEGEPVVLVCGLGQPAASWQHSILPELVAAGYQVVTFDNRGMPPSASPPAPYTVADMAADTAALIEHLGVGPCHVAGYSLGAWIAEQLAADHSDVVRSIACIGGLNQTTAWERVECRYGRDLAALDVPLPADQGLMEVLVYLPRDALQQDEIVDAFTQMFGNDPPWENPGRLGQWEAATAWTEDDDEAARWSRISVPCLALASELDIDSPPHHNDLALAHIPDGRLVVIPGATHLSPFEQPQAVAKALTHFFTSLEPQP
jgi:pimeloyl-ACP methyl ester carboxylesterase